MNLIQAGGSWSGHERNCCFLNTGQTRFANVSAVSGLDFLDDGRCVAPVDWDHDGDLDLWLSARTGPTLRFVRNNGTDGHHFVAFRLQGTTCNRDAIGARIEVHCGDEILIRTLHAGDGYLSQAGKWIHFGLGTKQAIDSVIVRWPSGDVQQFSGAVVDQHFRIVQGQNAVQVWTPPERTVALATSRLDTVKAERAQRVVLRDRVPMANLQYQTFDGTTAEIPGLSDGPVLVNLWATWCAPCLAELKEFVEKQDELKALGLDIVALNVEAVSDENSSVLAKAKTLISEKLAFPFRSGTADSVLLEKLDAMQEALLSLRSVSGQLPASFLIDRFGRLSIIYTGRVTVAQLLADVRDLEAGGNAAQNQLQPLPGRWINEPNESGQVLIALTMEFRKRGIMEDALRFGGLAADVMSRHNVPTDDRAELASMFFDVGAGHLQDERPKEALRHLLEAVRMRPDWAEAHTNLGNAFRQLNRRKLAADHLVRAVRLT